MNILEMGQLFYKKNLIFEQNIADIDVHPVIILLPTDINDEYAYCLHGTSDRNRYNNNKEMYYVYRDRLPKTTYLNLKHIVKIPNSFRRSKENANLYEIYDILKHLREYQEKNGRTAEFNEIKNKVDIAINYCRETKHMISAEELRKEELKRMSKINEYAR